MLLVNILVCFRIAKNHMIKFDHPQFTTMCQSIYSQALKRVPQAYHSILTCDKISTSDKKHNNRATFVFCIWGKPRSGFWNRDYCCYSIVHDPHSNILGEGVPFQVRFYYFLTRKETSKGQFKNDVYSIVKPLDGQSGFIFDTHHPYRIYIYKPYQQLSSAPKSVEGAAADLAWLMAWTLPAFTQMLGTPIKI